MDTNSDRQDKDKKEIYSSEDRELLISLLKEYSEKLTVACDGVNQQKIINRFLLLLLSILAPSFRIWIPQLDSFPISLTVILLVAFAFSIYVTKSVSDLKYKSKTIAIKLEKAVRITSQIAEHFEDNFSKRIELDFRLADAESALEYYKKIEQRRKGFFSFLEEF